MPTEKITETITKHKKVLAEKEAELVEISSKIKKLHQQSKLTFDKMMELKTAPEIAIVSKELTIINLEISEKEKEYRLSTLPKEIEKIKMKIQKCEDLLKTGVQYVQQFEESEKNPLSLSLNMA